MEPQRIYIGGLTPTINDIDVVGRFKPFGDVTCCQIVRGKSLSGDASACRGFAYVTFTPKDEAALARVFSLYNGCKWRGQKLRVELAKPDYTIKLQQEWQEQQLQQQQQAEATKRQSQSAAAADSQTDHTAATSINITVPGTRKSIAVDLTAKVKSYRNWFPLQREKRIVELDWEPPPPSKRVALQAAADAATYKPPVGAAVAGAHSNGQQQQQQLSQEYATAARGVAVPYRYKEHQQQQQQQQQQPAVKGLKKQLDQEHFSHLKLLKRIAEQEQSQQHQQQQHLEFLAAPAGKTAGKPARNAQQQKQQQQQTAPAGVVVFSDDENDEAGVLLPAAAAAAAAQDAAHQLDRFANDSDSESEQPVIAAPAVLGSGSYKQQQQQQQQPDLTQAAEDVSLESSGHDASQSTSESLPVREPAVASLQGFKLHSPAALAADADHKMASQQQQQHIVHLRPAEQPAAPAAMAAAAAVMQNLSAGTSTGQVSTYRGHTSLGAFEMDEYTDNSKVQSGSSDSSSGGSAAAEDDESSLQPGTDDEVEIGGLHESALKDKKSGIVQKQQQQRASAQPPHQLPTVSPAIAVHDDHHRDHHQHQQPQLAVLDFAESAEQPSAVTAASLLDERFGSDSEEILRDADSDDEEGLAGLSKQQKHSRDLKATGASGIKRSSNGREELLCPVVPRAGTGRAAVAEAVRGTGTALKRQQLTLRPPAAGQTSAGAGRKERPRHLQRKRGISQF